MQGEVAILGDCEEIHSLSDVSRGHWFLYKRSLIQVILFGVHFVCRGDQSSKGLDRLLNY